MWRRVSDTQLERWARERVLAHYDAELVIRREGGEWQASARLFVDQHGRELPAGALILEARAPTRSGALLGLLQEDAWSWPASRAL